MSISGEMAVRWETMQLRDHPKSSRRARGAGVTEALWAFTCSYQIEAAALRGESREERALPAHVEEHARQQVDDVHEVDEHCGAHHKEEHVLRAASMYKYSSTVRRSCGTRREQRRR